MTAMNAHEPRQADWDEVVARQFASTVREYSWRFGAVCFLMGFLAGAAIFIAFPWYLLRWGVL